MGFSYREKFSTNYLLCVYYIKNKLISVFKITGKCDFSKALFLKYKIIDRHPRNIIRKKNESSMFFGNIKFLNIKLKNFQMFHVFNKN